ncbi:Zinc finger C2H2-type [Trinorchestia longiramus]|nr:Zinc finger C2H2-type [Trinorchestia longiramus]
MAKKLKLQGDGNESEISSFTAVGNEHCDTTPQNSVHFSTGATHSLVHSSEVDINSALSGGVLSASSLRSAGFCASDADQLLSSVGRMEAFSTHANFMSLSSPSAERAGYRKALGSPRNSSIGSPGRGAASRDISYRYRDKYSRSNGDGSDSATGHVIPGSMTRSIISLGAVGSSLTHDCPMCLKHFQSRADVVRHMRTHTGERPFKCPHCEYSAALKGNLKSHIMSRHPDVLGNIDIILRNISPNK